MNRTLESLVREFLLEGRGPRGWTAATCEHYRWNLERWLAWLASQGVESIEALTRSHLRAWSAAIRDRWEQATCRVAITEVRSFLRWCAAEGLVSPELPAVLRVPPVPERVQRSLSPQEVARLLECCDRNRVHGLPDPVAAVTCCRNAAMVCMLYDTMVRAGALCALQLQDLSLERQLLVVREKGGQQVVRHFLDSTAARLDAWLELRPQVAAAGEDALFVSVRGSSPGQRLTRTGLRTILRNLGRRAGVHNVSAHAFRRGGAVAACQAGASDRAVQELGGWRKADMVRVYTRGLRAELVHEQYSPMRLVEALQENGSELEEDE